MTKSMQLFSISSVQIWSWA